MSMLPRLKPRCFYDLVIEVAIVRPGPIQGDMVHPYLRGATAKNAVNTRKRNWKRYWSRTLGVPLFQEQAMEIAIVAAGFTPAKPTSCGAAWLLLKPMANCTCMKRKWLKAWWRKVMKKILPAGYLNSCRASRAMVSRKAMRPLLLCWSIFLPGSNAITRMCFARRLLNSQPMGFYQPAQIVQDAESMG